MEPTVVVLLFMTLLLGRITSDCDSQISSLCGKPEVQPAASRIVGGHEATIGSWPWTVVLTEQDIALCAGAIISDHVILTAAHCFEESVSKDPSRWKVLTGKHHLQKSEHGEMTFNVREIVIHEGYVHDTVANDVALLMVGESIPYTNLIRPICLPSTQPEFSLTAGEPTLVAGWGDTKGTAAQGVLNEIRVPVISDDVCGSPRWYYHSFIPQKTFCAGYEDGGIDSCAGDSGGPLIAMFGERWYVSGIASWGNGCAEPRWPGIYTNVTYYLPWIKSKMSERSIDTMCDIPIG